jgi:hypothetical protein
VAVSIDPRDTSADAAAAKAKYLAIYRHPGGRAGWHFLTGPKAVVERIAGTVGFAYRCDAAIDQYMHPVGFVVAAANGRISHDLVVTDPPPAELRAAFDPVFAGLGRLEPNRLVSATHDVVLVSGPTVWACAASASAIRPLAMRFALRPSSAPKEPRLST